MCDGDDRLQVCLDTAHTFASGYDYPNTECRQAMFNEIDRSFGLSRIRTVHRQRFQGALRLGRWTATRTSAMASSACQGLQDVLCPWPPTIATSSSKSPVTRGMAPTRRNLETLRKLLSGAPSRNHPACALCLAYHPTNGRRHMGGNPLVFAHRRRTMRAGEEGMLPTYPDPPKRRSGRSCTLPSGRIKIIRLAVIALKHRHLSDDFDRAHSNPGWLWWL